MISLVRYLVFVKMYGPLPVQLSNTVDDTIAASVNLQAYKIQDSSKSMVHLIS